MRVRMSGYLYTGIGVNFPTGGARNCFYEYRMVLIVHVNIATAQNGSAL